MGRNVLVLGGGGREHALGWRLAASPSVDAVASAGSANPGLAALGPVHPDVDVTDGDAVARLAESLGTDLVVVGPEAPLVAGVADVLRSRDVPVFGPGAEAARLEGSKAYAKEVMFASGAPTGAYVETSDVDEAVAALERFAAEADGDVPYVVKADGLAAGKGVTVTEDLDAARSAVRDALVDGRFGAAGAKVVVEEFLAGPERSVFGVCDGEDVVLLAPAQDYKRAHDGDEGPNTGGMGAYTPVPGFGLDDVEHLKDLVFRPVLREMASRGAPFRGLLYAGLVDTADGPKLLEFNARFGDPETQVVLPRLASDLGDLLWASATGTPGAGGVADVDVAWHDDAFVTVVLASQGYPGDYPRGKEITGVDRAEASDGVEVVFHAGTLANPDGTLVTNGGRVLNVVGRGATVEAAREAAYAGAGRISWWGKQLRRDIAAGV